MKPRRSVVVRCESYNSHFVNVGMMTPPLADMLIHKLFFCMCVCSQQEATVDIVQIDDEWYKARHELQRIWDR